MASAPAEELALALRSDPSTLDSSKKGVLAILRSTTALKEFIALLKTRPDTERAVAQRFLLEAAQAEAEKTADRMADLAEWLEFDLAWYAQEQPENTETAVVARGGVLAMLEEDFPQFARLAKAGKKIRDNKRGYLRKIVDNWGEKVCHEGPYLDIIDGSEHRLRMLANLAAVTKGQSVEGKQYAAEAVMQRIINPGKGKRAAMEYTAGDFEKAAATVKSSVGPKFSKAALSTKLRNLGLELDDHSWLQQRPTGRAKTLEEDTARLTIEGRGS